MFLVDIFTFSSWITLIPRFGVKKSESPDKSRLSLEKAEP